MLKRLLILLVLISMSSSAFAQRFNKQNSYSGERANRFEASLLMAYQNSVSKDIEGGASLNLDKSFGWGLTVGYNWTQKLNLAYKLTVVNPDYTAVIVPEDTTIPPQTLNYSASKMTHQINGTYNFMNGPFTPYIQAGLGMTTLDSNVPDSPPTTGCWWDPWWGYVCTTTWSTYKATKFSYNVGLGLRWDVNTALFLRGAYNKEWVSVKSGSLSFDTLSMEAGLMF